MKRKKTKHVENHLAAIRNAKRIACKICHGFFNEDIAAIATLAYCEALTDYKKELGSFDNWLFSKVKEHIRYEARRKKLQTICIDYIPIGRDGLEGRVIARDILNKLYAQPFESSHGNADPAAYRRRFFKYYIEQKTLAQIGREEGTSERAIHQSIVNIRKRARQIARAT